MASHGTKSNQTWACDCCSVEGSFDLHEGTCANPSCAAEICVGCSHSCADCDGEFCRDCIVATPVAGVLHTATYACAACALAVVEVAA